MAEDSDTQRETSHGNAPIRMRGELSLVPNRLPTTVITDAATTGWSKKELEDTTGPS